MDNDYLFVYFSPLAQLTEAGRPPFSDVIEEYVRKLDEKSFNAFFEARFLWHWYPILTYGFNSWPVNRDLVCLLKGDKLRDAIGWSSTLATREDGQRFISALGLLSFLCREEKSPKEVPLLTKHFMTIRNLATSNQVDLNIGFWFSKIALFQLNTGVIPTGYEGTFDRAGLNIPSEK